MKVFISHKDKDSVLAGQIAHRLKLIHSIDSYLDVIDPHLGKDGQELAQYIRREMGKCTQLLAVISAATKESQWVPWEIGVATEKSYPLATYSSTAGPPEFLKSWPVLRNDRDVDAYATASKAASARYRVQKSMVTEARARESGADVFYRNMWKGIR